MSILPCLLLLASADAKFVQPAGFAAGFEHLRLPISLAVPLGIVEAGCTLLYLWPRTAVLGAILLTGYLGGAIVTHLRLGEPFIMQFLLGVLLWGGSGTSGSRR
jgi:hypothetical protein